MEHEDAGCCSKPDAGGGVSLATMQKWPRPWSSKPAGRGCWQDVHVELLESGVLGALRRLTVMLLHMRQQAER